MWNFCYINFPNFIPICFSTVHMSYHQWSKRKENTGKSQAFVVFCSKTAINTANNRIFYKDYLKDYLRLETILQGIGN